MYDKILEKLVTLDTDTLYKLLQDFKDKFSYYTNNYENFNNLFQRYWIQVSQEDYYAITSDIALQNKVKQALNSIINNKAHPFGAYLSIWAVFWYKNKALDTLVASKKAIKIAKKSYKTWKFIAKTGMKTVKYGGKIWAKLWDIAWWLISILWSVLWSVWWFLFSGTWIIVIIVVSIIIAIVVFLILLLTLIYQPLLNVPVKFSSYEMYVPLNNNEVAFKNVNTTLQKVKNEVENKANFSSKILNSLTANLANKNNLLLFLKNNQADLAKSFIYKCSKYSLISDTLTSYQKEKKQLSGEIQQLSGELITLNTQLSWYKQQLSGLNLQLKNITNKIYQTSDKLSAVSSLNVNLLYSGNKIIWYKNSINNYVITTWDLIKLDNNLFETNTGSNTGSNTSATNNTTNNNTSYEYYLDQYWNIIKIDEPITNIVGNDIYDIENNILKFKQTKKNLNNKVSDELGKYKITTLKTYLNSLTQKQGQLSNQVNNLNNQINSIKNNIDQITNNIKKIKEKLKYKVVSMQTLKVGYINKLKALGINISDSSNNYIIDWDLFNGWFGVNKVFYTWYKKQLKEQWNKINNQICNDVETYAYTAYIAPSWKKYNTTMVPGGNAYTMLFLDNINAGKNKVVDHNITQKDYDIFQKYYNSIVQLYKQLGEIKVFKNWISWKFIVRPKWLLWMDVLTNDNQSVVNIYNPFLWEKNTIKLITPDTTLDSNKKFIEYKWFNIDITKFNNWFHDIWINNLTKLPNNNWLDILYDSNTKNTYVPIKIDNTVLSQTCGIQWTLKQNLTVFIKFNWVNYYTDAVSYVNAYNSCVRSCKKWCSVYRDCYVPIFINQEKKYKQEQLSNTYNNQINDFCSQLNSYLSKFDALNYVKQDKFENKPSKIRVCYEEKPVFFNYMYKYNILAYNETSWTFGKSSKKFLDTREDKYHYTADGMYIPYLYKTRLPYKVCYDIDNIFLTKKLKKQLVEKWWTVKNYTKSSWKLWFVLDSHIDLNLISSLFFKWQSFPIARQTDKILFDVLNKWAEFNPIHLLYYLKQKNVLYSSLWLDINLNQNKDTVNYNPLTFDVWPGQESIQVPNSEIWLSTRFTNKLTRDKTLNINFKTFGYNYRYYELKYDLAWWSKIKRWEQQKYNMDLYYNWNGGNIENYIEKLKQYNDRYINEISWTWTNTYWTDTKLVLWLWWWLDFDRTKLEDNDLLKTFLEKDVINTFKLKENLYLSTTLNFIKSQLFNIDLAKLKQWNNIQSLLYIWNKQQVNTYYTLHLVNDVIKDKLKTDLWFKTNKLETDLKNNLWQIKAQYDLAKQNTHWWIWNTIIWTISWIKDTITWLFTTTTNIIWNIATTVTDNIKQRIWVITNSNISKSCAVSSDPVKCALDNVDSIDNDNTDALTKMYYDFDLNVAKPWIWYSELKMRNILWDNFKYFVYTQHINIWDIILNPFYSLFRETKDKKTEEKIWIYSTVSNILTDTNPNNVIWTLGIDKYNISVLVWNMLNNQYIIDRVKTAIKRIRLLWVDTKALDNLSKLKYDNIDINGLNRILWQEFTPFMMATKLKDNIQNYYKDNVTKNRSVYIPLYNLWFLYHAEGVNNGMLASPIINQIDTILKKKLGEEKFTNLVSGIEKHNISFQNNYSWYDIVWKYNDRNKQYKQFKDIINNVKGIFDNVYICFDPSYRKYSNGNKIVDYIEKLPEDEKGICEKSAFTLSTDDTNKTIMFLKYFYWSNSLNVSDNTAMWLIDMAKFLAYYGNNEGTKWWLDYIELFTVAWDTPYTDTNLFINTLLKANKYLKEWYTDLNMDTNWLYKMFNAGKIWKQNSITYTTYLVNIFSQIDRSVYQLKQLHKLLVGIKNKNQIYEVADVYLLDLLANQRNYLDNIQYVPNIHTYTQLKDYINWQTLPNFNQYSLFDAVAKKTQLWYLQSVNNSIDLDSYYYHLFIWQIKEKIDCNKTFTWDNILINKCINIKDDLVSSANITDFKFKMTKYAKEYDFVELWKQVWGLLYFTYQNQKYLWQAWDFKQTDEYKELTAKYWPNWVHKIAGAIWNCTWYANYLHWKSKLPTWWGIAGNAKDWCKNAEAKWYKVVYTKDIVNPQSQLKIGDIVVFNENYPTYYNYQMKAYWTVYGHVWTLIWIDDNSNAILIEEMNYTSIIKGGDTLWVVDRRWDTDWKKSTKCFIETDSFDWKYESWSWKTEKK